MHIADVSYFVKADTALDQVASQRATSVYLVQRVRELAVYSIHVHTWVVFFLCMCVGDSYATKTAV